MKRKLILLITFLILSFSITGCSSIENTLSVCMSMSEFNAKMSEITNSPIISSTSGDNYIKISHENDIDILTDVSLLDPINISCTIEGPEEIIKENLLNYLQYFFDGFDNNINEMVDSLLINNIYEMEKGQYTCYAEYYGNYLLMKMEIK